MVNGLRGVPTYGAMKRRRRKSVAIVFTVHGKASRACLIWLPDMHGAIKFYDCLHRRWLTVWSSVCQMWSSFLVVNVEEYGTFQGE